MNMQTKSICKTLLCFTLTCGGINAMYLTNGTTDKGELAKISQGLGSMSTQENYGEDYPSNLSQSKFKVERSLGGAGRVQFIGIVNSIGTDPVVAAKFQ